MSYYLKVADYDTTSDSNSFQIKGKKEVHKENAANLNLVFFPMKLGNFFPWKDKAMAPFSSVSQHICIRDRGISIACKLQIRHEYAPFWFCFWFSFFFLSSFGCFSCFLFLHCNSKNLDKTFKQKFTSDLSRRYSH